MENYSDLWSNTETNKFLFQQMKELLKPHGFIVLPKKSKFLARVRAHHIQMLHQDIVYGETRPSIIAIPTWTYRTGWFFSRHFYLKCSDEIRRSLLYEKYYGELAIKSPTGKKYYKPDELIKAWKEVMESQLQGEVITFFNELDFERFQILCEDGGDMGRRFYYKSYGSADQFFSIAYNNLWIKNYKKAEEFIEKAVGIYEQRIREENLVDSYVNEIQTDINNGKELLLILKNKEPNWEKVLEERISFIEKDMLEQVWGIALDEEGQTIKAKKAQKNITVENRC